jgi:ArsR family transcriptional regulator, cadmium/lead-responsive transcriptional repressor
MAAPVSDGVTLAAKLFRGFSDRTRLSILQRLAGGERRVTDLVDDIGGSQSSISGHLACLKDCGLVADRPVGRQVYYRIATPEVVAMLTAAERLLSVHGWQIELCPNYRDSADG